MILPLLFFSVLISLSTQQCITTSDDIRKISDKAHESLLQSELRFSADLLHSVGKVKPDKNVFFSPSSIFKAMLMSYFISANHTEASLKKTMHLASDEDKLDVLGAYNVENYYQKLRSIKGTYQLSNVNRLFVSKNIKVQHCVRTLFMDDIYTANFANNLEGVVRKINNWVAFQTRNVIKNFLSEESVTRDTDLVLVNAAYFKGEWKNQFDPEDTRKGKFHLSNGSVTPVELMTQENKFRKRLDKSLGAEVLELPYAGDDISMYMMLPLKESPSAIQDLLAKLDSQSLLNIIKDVGSRNLFPLMVTIPKFSVEEELELTPILESMGVGDLFQKTADLSTLSGAPGITFAEAIHKAKIQVDEKGTESAAATGFMSARFGVDSFIADRPFIYTVFDKRSNILLFFGIFNSPEL